MFDENEVSIKANGGTEIAKRTLAKMLDPKLLEHFQIISSRPRELKEDKIRVLFLHDLAVDPEIQQLKDPNYRNKFHKFVFISNWQFQNFQTVLGFPYDGKSVVIESGIDPAMNDVREKPKGTINLVYTSTPQRGLNILIPVFNKLCDKYDDLHLDVFSSFKIYGWDEQDKQFEPLYEQCRTNPKITYHGFKEHDQVLTHLKDMHIFAYPCTWQETSCRAMLEAMSAGCVCVHPNFAGLTDTSGGLNLMYQGDTDVIQHANKFFGYLENACAMVRQRDDAVYSRLNFNRNFVNGRFNILNIKRQWEATLQQLLQQYPDVDSRKAVGEMFVYRT